MAVPKKLQSFLKKVGIKAAVVTHKTIYTAFDLSSTLKTKLSGIAKTVVLKVTPPIEQDGKKYTHILAVLGAHQMLDFKKLAKLLAVKKVELDRENVMAKVFKVKPGAITPFAGYHKVPVVIDKTLAKAKTIITGAGSYTDSVKIKVKDLVKAGGKVIGLFGRKRE